jgi:D-alanyl-D-alanine carboxypeptidase
MKIAVSYENAISRVRDLDALMAQRAATPAASQVADTPEAQAFATMLKQQMAATATTALADDGSGGDPAAAPTLPALPGATPGALPATTAGVVPAALPAAAPGVVPGGYPGAAYPAPGYAAPAYPLMVPVGGGYPTVGTGYPAVGAAPGMAPPPAAAYPAVGGYPGAVLPPAYGQPVAAAPPVQQAPSRLTGDLTGLNPELRAGLEQVAAKLGTKLNVLSGNRTRAEQEELYQRFLNGTGNLAAPPGTSRHESGRAADVYVNGVALADVPGARKAAATAGLGFPVPGEAWHVERLR